MSDGNPIRPEKLAEHGFPVPEDFEQAIKELFEKALEDAKSQLHPLLRNADLDRLGKHTEFAQAFKRSLERGIAQKIAAWQLDVKAVFQFDESWMENRTSWDGSIHLLVNVPRLSNKLRTIGARLDQSLVNCLEQSGWLRFRNRQSILEIQQVMPDELEHRISYGAMFCAVYSTPIKVWPT
jgi:hypothetical protein